MIEQIPGASFVATVPAVAHIAAAAKLVLPLHSTAVVHGPPGTGKYSAARYVLQRTGVPVNEIDLEPAMSSKDMLRRIHRSVLGHEDVSERDLQDDLVDALAAIPRTIVIRHADRLTREAAGQLQWLHERPGATWSLFLVGSTGTGKALEREAHLRGSVLQTIEVTPLTGQTLLSTLQSMHPLLLGAGSAMLTDIDHKICHGVLQHWVKFLTVALHIRQLAVDAGNPAPVLDLDLARATHTLLPTTITARRHR